ncbi:hypothetical protein RRF57_011086 [Xylaria bambusicola]|uniref:Uncharacterized protein n=1 Tax=Xylaria bambusicola TaxID=326684 RepID=A0AAN7Z3B8_9PEZI
MNVDGNFSGGCGINGNRSITDTFSRKVKELQDAVLNSSSNVLKVSQSSITASRPLSNGWSYRGWLRITTIPPVVVGPASSAVTLISSVLRPNQVPYRRSIETYSLDVESPPCSVICLHSLTTRWSIAIFKQIFRCSKGVIVNFEFKQLEL